MSWLPIERILWAPSNADHYNHLHVEGAPSKTGTPPASNPGMSQSVQVIYEALREEFGTPFYFEDAKPPAPSWSHMGWYNRRKISGSNSWSQHAWSNALDIGPYYGVAEQQKFYDFLTSEEPPMSGPADNLTEKEVNLLKTLLTVFEENGKQSNESRKGHFDRIVKEVHPAGDGGGVGLQRGDTVTLQ